MHESKSMKICRSLRNALIKDSHFKHYHVKCGVPALLHTARPKAHQKFSMFNISLTQQKNYFLKLSINHIIQPVQWRSLHSVSCHFLGLDRHKSTLPSAPQNSGVLKIGGVEYETDEWTNITPKIFGLIGRNLHLEKEHPIQLIKELIVEHFNKEYRKRRGPIFAVFDNLSPVVTVGQNFDLLLTPSDHVSRQRSDNYYINSTHLLRAHTTAHEHDLIKSGLDAFITVGDVYRRDAIDSTHFPAFHQLEGVRLFNRSQNCDELKVFRQGEETTEKQGCHTLEASKLVECQLKDSLIKCMRDVFGQDMRYRWVDAYFPFTHPSFELEVRHNGQWLEVLGCGVLRHDILQAAGAGDSIGWAFGCGLERLAMRLFEVPDIRCFWSKEESLLSQFRNHKDARTIKFKPLLSNQPVLVNDISFWVPDGFHSNDFYDLVRSEGGELVENASIVDEFVHPRSGRTSHCYRLFYRHPSRPLAQAEVDRVHARIRRGVVERLGGEGRW